MSTNNFSVTNYQKSTKQHRHSSMDTYLDLRSQKRSLDLLDIYPNIPVMFHNKK
jgi:hypothetical protein